MPLQGICPDFSCPPSRSCNLAALLSESVEKSLRTSPFFFCESRYLSETTVPNFPITGAKPLKGYGQVSECWLYLDPAQASSQQPALANWMAEQQLTGSFDVQEGLPVLRVRTSQPEAMLKRLETASFIAPNASQSLVKHDPAQPKPTLTERIKRNTVRLAGAFYMVGNLFTVASGLKRLSHAKQVNLLPEIKGAKAELLTGLAFTAGDSVMLAFGHRTPEQQLDKVARSIADIAKVEGWEIPATSPIKLALARSDTTGERLGNFLREHVLAFKAVTEVTAGAAFAVAGLRQENMKKAASGALLATGFALGQIIPERKPAYFRDHVNEGTQDHSAWGRFKEWIERKPMRVSGSIAFTNNVMTAWGALDESKKAIGSQGFWKYNMGQAGSFMAANALLFTSSKTNTQTVACLLDQAYAMSSNLVLQLSPEKREHAIEALARTLARQPEIDATFDEARTALTERVTLQERALIGQKVEPAPEELVTQPVPSFAERVGQRTGIDLASYGKQKDQRTDGDAVPREWGETVRREKTDQAAHHEIGG